MRFPDHLTTIADVVLSTATDGEVRVNVGDVLQEDESGFGQDVALWGVPGFIGMPDQPDDNGAAQVLYIVDGQKKIGVAARDNRIAEKAGNLQPGDRAVLASCAARILLKAATSSVTLFTENEQDNDLAQMIDLRGSTGVTLLLNGNCIVQQKTDELVIAINDGATFTMNADGFQFTGAKFNVACSTVTLGILPGGIPPQPGINSAIYGPAGQVGVASQSVTIAP